MFCSSDELKAYSQRFLPFFSLCFKKRVFSIVEMSPFRDTFLRYINEAMEANNISVFRNVYENFLEVCERTVKPRILMDDGDMRIWNAQVDFYMRVLVLYNEFMDEFINELDELSEKNKQKLKNEDSHN